MQSILNNDIKTNSDFIFAHGSAASGGSTNCRNNAAFIKLDQTTNALPTDLTTVEGVIFTEATTSIKFRVDKVEVAAGADPAVCYVTYLDANNIDGLSTGCLLYTSPSPRDKRQSRMPSSA